MFLSLLLLASLPARADAFTPRAFECTQVTLTDPGTALAVSGSIIPLRARPTSLTVSDADTGVALVTNPGPRLTNSYDGGYWLMNYGLNAWSVGRYATTSYMFLIPNTALGGEFDAQLHEIFGPRGAWGWYPLEMECRFL